MKPNKLTLTKVHAISLVDRPASVGADILIAKRDSMCEACQSGTCKKHVKKSITKGEAVALAEQILDAVDKADGDDASIELTLDADETMTDNTGTDSTELLKSADPALAALVQSIQKQNDELAAAAKAAEARIAKMEAEREHAAAVAVAKGIAGDFDVDTEKLATVLKALPDDGRQVVADVLAKANAIAKNSGLLRVPGADVGADSTTPMARINKRADELLAAGGGLTRPQAIAKALAENPTLYT